MQGKENSIKKIIRNRTYTTVLYCIYRYHKFMPTVYKMSWLSVPMSVSSYMIQSAIDVIEPLTLDSKPERSWDKYIHMCLQV